MCTHLAHGRAAADAVLSSALHLDLRKALELSTPADLDRAVAQLASSLRHTTQGFEAQALREALSTLDVNWAGTSPAQRSALVRQAMSEARATLTRAIKPIEARLGPAAEQVLRATRRDGLRRGLTIAADFNAVDRRMLKYLRTSETMFVREEIGRRAQALSARARATVADGLERGLGRDDIAAALEQAVGDALRRPGGFYWETIAASFTGRARSLGQLSSFAEAGIERYRIEAVLDENTTAVCRFLHGKVFTVASALASFREAEAQPERLKDIAPWVRERRDPETGRRLLYVKRGDERTTLAEELRSGVGRRDDVGEFASRGALGSAAMFPPFHGLCRSTLTTVL
jgi:SPP1 gp7 family putative phage head morphogenesis protein